MARGRLTLSKYDHKLAKLGDTVEALADLSCVPSCLHAGC